MINSFFSRYYFLIAIALLSGCAHLPDNRKSPKSYAITSNTQSPALALIESRKSIPKEQSGFVLLSDGHDDFAARMILAERAKHSIDLATYIFTDDLIGRAVLDSMRQAADRGVRVRMLLDDQGTGARDLQFASFDQHPNIEIRLFNPFKRSGIRNAQLVTRFNTVTRRMHNKSLIIDNQLAIVGGRNISNEYFSAKSNISYGDLDAITVGPVVQEVSDSFDQFWNNTLAYPINMLVKKPPTPEQAKAIRDDIEQYAKSHQDSEYADALRESKFVDSIRNNSLEFFWGNAKLIADKPEKLSVSRDQKDTHLEEEMAELFEKAQEEILIFSPYFIPGKKGTQGLIDLEKSGVHLRILTNSLASNDHAIVHGHYTKYRKALLAAGVEIYELRMQNPETDEALHAKALIFDRNTVFIGSLNMDPRSWVENTEMGVVLENKELGEGIGAWFDSGVAQKAYKVELKTKPGKRKKVLTWISEDGTETYKEPDTSFWKRFTSGFYRKLPIESLL